MKSFKYWATHVGILNVGGLSEKAVFVAGSNTSEYDAKVKAVQKFDLVQNKIYAKKNKLEDYEVEIREEQVQVIDEFAVITRNRYGAHVLNTEKLMILDVDTPPTSFLDLFAKKTEQWKIDKLINAVDKLHKSLNEKSISFRIYKTCKGFRVILVGKDITAEEELAHKISKALNVDKLYWLLCKKQNCYRARLTPKPSRIKHKAIRINFPDCLDKKDEILAWEKAYLEKANNFSVCKFIKEIGNNSCNSLVSLHDNHTGAISNRMLA